MLFGIICEVGVLVLGVVLEEQPTSVALNRSAAENRAMRDDFMMG